MYKKLGAKFFILICLCIPAEAYSQLFDDIEFYVGSTKSENYSFIFEKLETQPFSTYEFSLENKKLKIDGEFYKMYLLNTKNDKILSAYDRITIQNSIQELTEKYGFEKLYISPNQNKVTYKRASKKGTISYLEISIPDKSEEFCQVVFCNKMNHVIPIKDKSFESYRYSYFGGEFKNDWIDCSHRIFPGTSPPELHTNGTKRTGFYSLASDKLNCISLSTRRDSTWEMLTQKLERQLKKDSCYKLSFDTRYEKTFQSAIKDEEGNPSFLYVFFDNPISLKISLSNSECGPEEVIYLSDPISHKKWEKSNIEFTPTQNYKYVILEASYNDKVGFGHILLDNFSDIFSVNCTK